MVQKIKCGKCGSTNISLKIDGLVTIYHCHNCNNINAVDVDKELDKMYKKDKKKFLKNEVVS
ncbi:MAG: hypothetical protein KJ674_01485 [Nanoarchaeota archaeon]|nr:hypothetical protein [Nanoarchaeota archaeon]